MAPKSRLARRSRGRSQAASLGRCAERGFLRASRSPSPDECRAQVVAGRRWAARIGPVTTTIACVVAARGEDASPWRRSRLVAASQARLRGLGERRGSAAGERRVVRVEHDAADHVGRQLADVVERELGGERRHRVRDNRPLVSQLARIAWLVTVGICLIAALILLLSGYDGYAGVTLAVGDRRRRSTCSELGPRPAARGPRARGGSARRRRAGRPAIASWSSCAVRVRLLERGAVAELHVQVDVAARAGLAGAQLVVADDAAVGERLDRRPGSPSSSSSGSASSTSTRSEPIMIRTPVTTIAHGDHERDDRVEPVRAGDADQASPTSTPIDV